MSANALGGRKRHDKRNIHSLNERDKRLMNKALEYNKKIRHYE